MGSEAFDRLLSRLDSEERERIHAMAVAYGLTFDDPSWIPFAITQTTLDELKAQVEDAADAIEKAADLALRRIGNSARVVSNQAQTVIEAQSRAVQDLRATMRDIERASAIEYRKLLTELAAQQVGKLIETGTNGIVRDVTQQLTGKNGLLTRSAVDHAAALEASRQQFVAAIDASVAKVSDAGKKAAAATRRGVGYTVLLAMGAVALCAAVMFGLIVFGLSRLPAPDSSPPRTCASVPHATFQHRTR